MPLCVFRQQLPQIIKSILNWGNSAEFYVFFGLRKDYKNFHIYILMRQYVNRIISAAKPTMVTAWFAEELYV